MGRPSADERAETARQDAEELTDAVAQLRRSVRRSFGSPWPRSLTAAQLDLLRVIRRRPGISVGEGAQELAVAPNTVSTLVGQLSDAGLIERQTDVTDRRVARLDLTPSARRDVDEWRLRRSEHLAAALESLDDRDREHVSDALPALLRLAGHLQGTPGPK
jgi:DNA-binding MarR family transcriptional regulator